MSKSEKVTALVDADIPVFQAAAVAQKWIEFDDGYWVQVADEDVGYEYIDSFMAEIAEALGSDIVCTLSDREHNWRKDVLPSYKENRTKTVPPFLRYVMYDYIIENFDTYIRPTLEGDDVLGILSTSNKIPGKKIIVSIDKDLKTIPGTILNWNHARHAVNTGVIPRIEDALFEVTEEQADYFHLLQTLAGDATDGYKGCPGIGMQTADAILSDAPHVLYEEVSEYQSGKRKGEEKRTWKKSYKQVSQWDTIVSYFEKAGLDKAAALQQARVARICRAQDYDFSKKEVKLWTP